MHHEVTQDSADNRQLQPMAEAAKAVLEQESLTIVADAGYSHLGQFQACDDAGIMRDSSTGSWAMPAC